MVTTLSALRSGVRGREKVGFFATNFGNIILSTVMTSVRPETLHVQTPVPTLLDWNGEPEDLDAGTHAKPWRS